MEYNLQKTIEPSLFGQLMPQSMYPKLTEYPANDYVNPGVGQITRLYSFYVPLYSKNLLHEIIDSLVSDQLGAGTDNEILQKLNERKRKLLGDNVFDSFMHPKPFKTKKIELKGVDNKKHKDKQEKASENKKKESEKKEKASEKNTNNKKQSKKQSNHKFQFY
jgi:hypothetical protein